MFQGSLFDADQAPHPRPLDPHRTELDRGAWIDLCPAWLAGADELFLFPRDEVAWKAERRHMYDKIVDVPRLVKFYDEDEPLPHAALVEMRDALDRYYETEPFRTVGMCYYRDGRDSVAWHGDTIGRGATEDTMVAIVSVGEPRALTLRPRGGGRALKFELGHGDLLVMGGSCQRTWEHAIPKTARPTGPRISIQYRVRDVR
jgi:alkylated DNA repair dioxygenase AlkB